MNSTNSSSGGGTNGFNYGSIGISVAVLFAIIIVSLIFYWAKSYTSPRRHQRTNAQETALRRRRRLLRQQEQSSDTNTETGIDEATLASYPKQLYSEAKVLFEDSTASCCSICLADYKDTDMLRLLPECGHLFHDHCIDPWLRLHSSCPVCRTSPLPTPLSTPLAEVVPLASRT